MATVTRVYQRETSAALERRRRRTPEQRAAISAEFERMASDPDYQAEARRIETEFARSDWEAFEQAEPA